MPNIPYKSKEEIYKIADEFKNKYAYNEIPVDIESIIEFDLGINLDARLELKSCFDVDAIITSNFETIFVDKDSFTRDNSKNRFRFSLAHELGHKILHKEFYQSIGIASIEDWLSFYEDLSEKDYGIIEYQVNEFAGRLLVDPERLKREVNYQLQQIPDDFDIANNKDIVISSISQPIAEVFHVSPNVIEIRIIREEILT